MQDEEGVAHALADLLFDHVRDATSWVHLAHVPDFEAALIRSPLEVSDHVVTDNVLFDLGLARGHNLLITLA